MDVPMSLLLVSRMRSVSSEDISRGGRTWRRSRTVAITVGWNLDPH